MNLRKITSWTACLAIVVFTSSAVWGYSSGPPDGVAGDPPLNLNCTQCHNSFTVNSGSGTLQFLDIPAEYRPDSTYTLTVSLEQAEQRRWGFEMTVILANGDQAGVMTAIDNTVQVSEGAGATRDYAKHTVDGTFPAQTSATWQLDWTAPSAGSGAVDFYLAGNAANANQNFDGDYIYTLSVNVPEEILGIEGSFAQQPRSHTLLSVYPNPFNPVATVHLSDLPAGEVRIEILNVFGQVLSELNFESLAGSVYHLPLDMAGQPSGHYFIRANYPGGSSITPVVKIR